MNSINQLLNGDSPRVIYGLEAAPAGDAAFWNKIAHASDTPETHKGFETFLYEAGFIDIKIVSVKLSNKKYLYSAKYKNNDVWFVYDESTSQAENFSKLREAELELQSNKSLSS